MVSSPAQAPSAQRDQGYDILLAFKDWLRIQEERLGRTAPDPDGDSAREEFHFSPGIAAGEPAFDAHRRPGAGRLTGGIAGRRPSVARRVFRTVAVGFIITAIVAAALILQSSDQTQDILSAWGSSLSRLSSVLRTDAPPGAAVAAAPAAGAPDQAQAQNSAPPQAAPATQPAATSAAAGSSADPQRQLQAIVNDLTAVRRIVEQLAAKQEQMAQDIATLQAADQSVLQKMSALPQSPAAHVPPHKNGPRIVHSETTVQSPPVPLPAPPRPAQAPLPLR
jgi:hypothetical protein